MQHVSSNSKILQSDWWKHAEYNQRIVKRGIKKKKGIELFSIPIW
jgi:hypothetical protein